MLVMSCYKVQSLKTKVFSLFPKEKMGVFQIQKCGVIQPPFFSNLAKMYSTVVCTMVEET